MDWMIFPACVLVEGDARDVDGGDVPEVGVSELFDRFANRQLHRIVRPHIPASETNREATLASWQPPTCHEDLNELGALH